MSGVGGSKMSKRVLWVGLWLAVAACDDGDSKLGPGAPLGGGTGSDAAGFDVPLAEVQPGGAQNVEVRLQILAPAAQSVLGVAMAPEVRAKVQSVVRGTTTPAADPIIPESVRFFINSDDEQAPAITGTLTGPTFMSEYAGRADLTPLPTGRYWLTVTAATRDGAQAASRIEVLIDAGPRITILSPHAQGAYKGSVAVDVSIDATPFELGAPPEVFVGSAPVPVMPGDGPGRFRALLEFNKFMPALIDDQLLRVRATNKQGTPAEARVIFFIDDDGPLITDTQPADGQVVGGVVRIAAKLTDRAGVLGPSVTAFIGNRGGEGFELELHQEGTEGTYSALFDTRKLTVCQRADRTGLCVLWPNLSFRASDLLGNERVVAYDVGIDNQPPVADLDSRDMRVYKPGLLPVECSHRFDPLGAYTKLGDMPNDGCGVGQVFDLRARVEDLGNWASGVKLPPTATVEPSSVHAYVLDDTSQPLAVDLDGDEFCDGVNPLLIPTTMPPRESREVLKVRLAPVTPKGSGDFTPDRSIPGDPDYPECRPGTDIERPEPLCIEQEMILATGYYTAKGPEPAIWAIEPIRGPYCVGSAFDAEANQIMDGWACIVVVATDRAGNTSASHPLRVYVNRKQQNTGPVCPVPPGTPPDCTGRYDRQTNAIVPGTCRGLKFGDRPGIERQHEILRLR
jgi:hypothetical protein